MCKLTLRRATPQDTTAIERIARHAWHGAYDEFLGPTTVEEIVSAWYSPETLRADITDPATVVRLAIEDETPVGFGHAGPLETDGVAGVHRLYVVPDRWGNGIGRRLWQTIETELRADGFGTIKVAVLAENEIGIGFYESIGCERIDTRSVDMGGETRREYVYRKSV